MKKNTLIISSLLVITGLVGIPVVFSDNHIEWDEYRRPSIGVAPVNNPMYKEECGSCHMAYPPGLLPSASWNKLMGGLADHFGDNAELDPAVHKQLLQYLEYNSADFSAYRRSRKIMASLDQSQVPVRITATPYFQHKHDEIPARMVKGNKQVNSFSNCNACHGKATLGLFDEHSVRIPGYGRWDD